MELQEKIESKKTEPFLLSGLVHENYRPKQMIIIWSRISVVFASD